MSYHFPPSIDIQHYSNPTCTFRSMATNGAQEKWDQVDEEFEEEEEALSLCDLPVKLINEEVQSRKEDSQILESQEEEFDFCSLGGLFSNESEMCAADEVFFQGQILPLRHSFSSDSRLTSIGSQCVNQILNRSESKSESSLDHDSPSEFRSNSSRSSSVRSQNSSCSTSSTASNQKNFKSKPRIQNQFHTHPSPKPQLRLSGPTRASFSNQGRKSSASAWEFFRLGVVPAPEIELQDLKIRSSSNSANKNSVSRNSSSSSSNSANSTTKSTSHHNGKSNHIFKQFVGKGGGLLSGCKCSVETVKADIVVIKSGTKSTNKIESRSHAKKEKVMIELKKQNHKEKQGKKVMSRRRTFEWVKELHANHPEEEALLSNS